MLDREPQAGPISWMIPISRALQAGGIQAAQDCCAEIQEDSGEGYIFDAYELLPLVYQIASAGKMDIAIEVLKLNLQAFPEHEGSRQLLSQFHHKQGACDHEVGSCW